MSDYESNVKIKVDDSELTEAQKKIDDLKNKKVKVSIDVDDKDTSKTTDGLAKSIDKANESVKNLDTSFKNIASTKLKYEAFKFIEEQCSAAVKAVTELNTAMTKVNMTMLDMPDSKLDDLASQSLDMAKELSTYTKTVTDAVTIYANANETVSGILEKSQPTVLLASAADMRASEAADTIQGIINQFNLEDSDAMHVADSIEKLSSEIAVDFSKGIETISQAVKVGGSVMEEAGLSYEKYGAIVSAAAEKTRASGSVLGNAYKTIASRISRSKDGQTTTEQQADAEKAFNSVGVSIRSTDGTFRDLSDTLDDLNSVWGSLNNTQRSYVAEAAAGVRQKNIFLAMMNTYERALELENAALNSSGTSMEINEKRINSIAGKIQKLSATMTEAYNNALPEEAIKKMIDFQTNIVEVVDALNLLQGALATVGALGVSSIVSKILSNWGTIAGMLTNPTTLFAVGLGAAVSAITTFEKYQKELMSNAVSKAQGSKAAYDETVQELKSMNVELETANARISELQSLSDAGTITLAEESELETLKLQNQELERQIALKQQLADEQSKTSVDDAVAALKLNRTQDLTRTTVDNNDEVSYVQTGLIEATQNEIQALAEAKDRRNQLIEDYNKAGTEKEKESINKQIDALDGEISGYESALSENMEKVNSIYDSFIDSSTGLMREGLSQEAQDYYEAMSNLIDDYNNIDLSPAERQLKKLDAFFSNSKSHGFIKKELMDAAKSGKSLDKVLKSMGLSIDDIGIDNIDILKRYLDEAKSSAEGAAKAVKSLSDTEDIGAVTTALEKQDAGYNYEQAVSSAEKVKELVEQGLIGKDEVGAFADYLSYGVDSSIEAYEAGIEKFNRYFTTDSAQGVGNFLEDLTSKSEELGKTWATKNDNGGWDFDIKNTAEVAKEMGMGVAEIEDIFGRLQDYGFNIEWHSAIGDLNQYKDTLDGVKSVYDKMSDGAAKERLGKLIDGWDESLVGFEDDLSTLTDEQIVHIKFEYNLASVQAEIDQAWNDVESGKDRREAYGNVIAGNSQYISQAKQGMNLSEIDMPVHFDGIEYEISTLKNQLSKAIEEGASEEQIIELQAQIANKQELEKSILNDFSDQHPEITPETDISQVQAAVDDYFSKPQHLMVASKLDYNTIQQQLSEMASGSTIKFNADIDGVERTIEAVKNEDGSITYIADIDGEPTEVQLNKDGSITYVVNEVQGTKVETPEGPYVRTVNEVPGTQVETDVQDGTQYVDREFAPPETSVEDASQHVNRTYDAVSTQLPDGYQTIYRTIVESKSNSSGPGGVNGTAHPNGGAKFGIAHAKGTIQDTSWLKDEWKTKKDNTALVGEAAPELMVNPKTNTWETIGNNGAEFRHIPSGAIIFNAKQTKELLSKGFTKSRGRSMLHGTAYAGGMNGNGKFYGGASSYNPGGGGGSSSNTITSDTSKSIDEATESAEEFSEELDEIAIKIDRIERAIKNIEVTAESSFETYSTRSNALKEQISAVGEEISIQQQGYERYMQQANSVGLSEEYAAKVREGKIDIETITDEDLSEKIKKYQQWYNLALDCRDAEIELRETSKELYQKEFDLLVEEYENIRDLLDHNKNMLEGYIDQVEAQGYITSQKYYTELIANEENTLNQLYAERTKLTAALNNALANGEIEKGSDAWSQMQLQIDETNEAIQKSNTNIIEWGNNIRDIDWTVFDKIQDSISNITTEADFLIKLMSSKDLFDDKGVITSQGKATAGLHAVNYNTYMSQADEYGNELEKIESELAKDPYNQTLVERRKDLLELQQESIIAAEDEKLAIQDLVRDGIEKELDSLQDLIDKYMDAANSQQDMLNYQKEIAEKQKEINELEKQYMAYKNDDSEEGAANRQKLQNQLNELKIDLEETQQEKAIDEQRKLLDELYSDYETVLNMRLDNLDVLISDVITNVNTEAGAIRETLQEEADSVGYTLTESMNTIWTTGSNNIVGVITKYGDSFTTSMTGVQTAINELKNILQQAVGASDKKANENVEKENKQQQQQQTPQQPPKPAPPKKDNSNKNAGGDGVPKVGDIVTLKAGQQYYSSSWGSNPVGSMYAGVPGGVVIDSYSNKKYGGTISNTGSYDVHIKSADGKYTDLGWVRLDQLEGYKNGTNYVDKDKWAFVGEGGYTEMQLNKNGSITLSDGTVLEPVEQGTKILTNAQTQNIFDWGHFSPKDMLSKSVEQKLPDVVPTSNNINIKNEPHLEIQIDKVMDYNDFAHQMQNDNRIIKFMQEVTIGRTMGHPALRKNHISL